MFYIHCKAIKLVIEGIELQISSKATKATKGYTKAIYRSASCKHAHA